MIPDRIKLQRRVSGALRAAITAHGSITPTFTGSAAKRVVGQLMADQLVPAESEEIKQQVMAFIQRWEALMMARRKCHSKGKQPTQDMCMRAKNKQLNDVLSDFRKTFGLGYASRKPGKKPTPVEDDCISGKD